MIENIDDSFGRLMERLADWKALDNTLVIFMTDNGATHLNGKLNGESIKHFNAHLKGDKNSPHEGGTHVPAFWRWKGVLGVGVDVDALTAHVDLYTTFCELADVQLPQPMQELEGRSLLPLLENPRAEWSDRVLFVHCGPCGPDKRDDYKFTKCAVRTERWRFVNNQSLYDISNDPFEQTDVDHDHPDVVEQLRISYDQWWELVLPLVVNEGLPRLKEAEHPLNIRYYKQLQEEGIPDWTPK